jgi:predicted dehydrogenase
MADPVRVGVVGLGFGAAVHVPAFRDIEGVELTVLAGRDGVRARALAAHLGIPVGSSVDALFDHDLDAVTIALPPGPGAELAEAAIGRRLPVFAEKPLAATVVDAHRLAAAAVGVTTAIDFEFAELETFRALRRVVQGGELGGVRAVYVQWLTSSWSLRSGVWSWKTDRERGGGVMSLLASHVLYLLESIFGPVQLESASLGDTVTASIAPPAGHPAADVAVLTAVLPGGAPVSLQISNSAPGPARHRWDVVTEEGRYVAENSGPDWAAGFSLTRHPLDAGVSREVAREAVSSRGEVDSRVQPVGRLARRFVAAVRTRDSCTPGFAEGARVQELIAQAESLACR